MSFQWLFRLILNDVWDFATYWIFHIRHSNKQITLLLWQVARWKFVKVSLVLGACKCCCFEKHGVHWPMVVGCGCMRNFWLFFVFAPISSFKRTRKAIKVCILFVVSLKLLLMFNMCQCLFIFFYSWKHWAVCYRKWN